jgi:hypothetical protein
MEQRNISQKWLEARLKAIPLQEGKHEKHLEGTNIFVAYHDDGEKRYVITIFLDKPPTVDEPKRYIGHLTKQEHVRDLYDKSKQRTNRRMKNMRNLKKR